MKKEIIFGVIAVLLVGAGVFYFLKLNTPQPLVVDKTIPESPVNTEEKASAEETKPIDKTKTVLGASAGARDIVAYHYGTGTKEVLFVGGIHGGYEWNTSLLAYEVMDYLAKNPTAIPENLKVTVIPVLNPDGLYKAVGKTEMFAKTDVSKSQEILVSGRFNDNMVDLNRNFDCDWKAEGKWLDQKVSGGSAPFSEPESQAFKKYIETNNPAGAVVWYSSASGVYASSCGGSIASETRALMDIYAKAAQYKSYDSFNYYEITGDMVNWLAKNNIPAVSVLLTTHQDTEFTKNIAGVKAALAHYAK